MYKIDHQPHLPHTSAMKIIGNSLMKTWIKLFQIELYMNIFEDRTQLYSTNGKSSLSLTTLSMLFVWVLK